jgi:hypothetical protein
MFNNQKGPHQIQYIKHQIPPSPQKAISPAIPSAKAPTNPSTCPTALSAPAVTGTVALGDVYVVLTAVLVTLVFANACPLSTQFSTGTVGRPSTHGVVIVVVVYAVTVLSSHGEVGFTGLVGGGPGREVFVHGGSAEVLHGSVTVSYRVTP